MALFKQLESLLQEGDQVTVVVTKAKDGRLSAAVVLTPKEASNNSISPYVATGTAEELDENVLVELPKVVETVKGFHSNMNQVESEAKKKTAKPAKGTSTKKEDTKPSEPEKKPSTEKETAATAATQQTSDKDAASAEQEQSQDVSQQSAEDEEAKMAAIAAERKEKAKELWLKASEFVKAGKLAEAKEVLIEDLKYCNDKQRDVINKEIAKINVKLGIKEE